MNLFAVFRNLSLPMAPLPTGVTPDLPIFSGIRGVVFDIYGTLFVSGSGDIGLANGIDKDSLMLDAFRACGIEFEGDHPPIVPLFHDTIVQLHAESHARSVDFPEVEIREVWTELLRRLSLELEAVTIERLAVEYECRVNPVWPMPALSLTLSALKRAGMRLGIVSNAQFYTPLMFEAFMGETMESLGFDEELSIWSYRERRGKPSIDLYAKLAATLLERGIDASEILYVGNDIRNDIWPAQEVGFLTALFAGDRRSLRMRENDPLSFDVIPDAKVVTLSQVLELVGIANVKL